MWVPRTRKPDADPPPTTSCQSRFHANDPSRWIDMESIGRMARIGVMGCGVVADYGHLPAIVRTPGLELVSVFDPVAANAQREADRFGVKAFTNQNEFLQSGLDAVVVCSPVPFHRENVFAAAE